MPRAELATTSLNFERRGSGEPLLLIQGMSGTHATWGEPFLTRLEDAFEILYYDHRGVGESAPQSEPFTIEQLATDAAQLLDHVGWDSAHVMGISMGGMVAQELALADVGRIRTLTLGCTYPGGEGSALSPPETGAVLGEALQSGDRETTVRGMWSVNVSEAFAAGEGHFDDFYAMATSVKVPMATVGLQMQAIFGHDVLERLRGLDVPTLVVHGTEDRMLPVANGELIAATIPGARLEVLEGVGHLFWWEQPERSAQLLRDFALSASAAA